MIVWCSTRMFAVDRETALELFATMVSYFDASSPLGIKQGLEARLSNLTDLQRVYLAWNTPLVYFELEFHGRRTVMSATGQNRNIISKCARLSELPSPTALRH